jgi:hypothetical protein
MERTPFDIVDVFVARRLTFLRGEQASGHVFLEIGMPLRFSDARALCCWNLLTADSELVARGVSQGDDVLQALLRSVSLIRAWLDRTAAKHGGRWVWEGHEDSGLPESPEAAVRAANASSRGPERGPATLH